MKAKSINVGTRVRESYYWDVTTAQKQSRPTGVVIYNDLRQGDEVIAVEWDINFVVSAINVNDVSIIE